MGIPDGTATVSAKLPMSRRKSATGENLGRRPSGSEKQRHESGDLGIVCFRASAEFGSGALLRENGCGILWDAAAFYYGGMNMKNKKTWIAVIAVALVVILAVVVSVAMKPKTAEGGKSITVTVVHKDETEKVFTYTTEEEYLGPVLVAEGLVEGENSDFGLMITVVDGEEASWDADQSYWALYIGEEYASTGADSTPVNDGDSFKLVYTIG